MGWDPAAQRRLDEVANAHQLTAEQTQQLARYVELLLFWNQRINITAVRDELGVVEKHLADSLAVLPHLPPGARSLVDVGSGGGFPGAVLAVARPSLVVHLVEPNHKKAAFLSTLARELPLPAVTVFAERVEAYARRGVRSDVAVSRATWAVDEWLPIGRSLVAPDGVVLGMEGAEEHALPAGAVRHPYPLYGATRSIIVARP